MTALPVRWAIDTCFQPLLRISCSLMVSIFHLWSWHLGRVVLLGMVVAAPWCFGSVQPAAVAVLCAAAAAALMLALLSLDSERSARLVPLSVLPLLIGIGLAIGQLVVLPREALERVAPHTLELRRQLGVAPANGPSPVDEAADSAGTISLYPAATRLNLALLVLATAVFLLAARFFSNDHALAWLCGVVTASGAALTFFGIVQQLTWNGKLFWFVPLTYPSAPFGPFVNRNNGAGYLNLCLAAALACVIRLWTTPSGWRSPGHPAEFKTRRTPTLEAVRHHLLDMLAGLDALKLAALTAMGLIIAGILCSLSRGGSIALAGALLITCLLLWWGGQRRIQVLLVSMAAVLAIALLLWVGRGADVQQRLGTLVGINLLEEGRVPHWQTSLQAVPDFLWLGSGLGTYKFIYPMYDHTARVGWFYHAENQYVEALVEGGLCGIGLLLSALALVAYVIWRLFTQARATGDFTAAIMGLYAVSSQAIASCFDFGLYTPATMILFALICGAAAGNAAQGSADHGSRWLTLPRPRGLLPLLLGLLLVGSVQGAFEFRSRAAVEHALKRSNDLQLDPTTSSDSVEKVANTLRRSVQQRWNDAEAHQQLAHLLMQQYRLEIYHELAQQYPQPEMTVQLWRLASPVHLHRRIHELLRSGNTSELAALRERSAVVRHLEAAYAHLRLARQTCPLLAEVHLDLGEIRAAVTAHGANGEAADLERARILAPADPNALYRTGLLDLDAQRVERACQSWRRSLELSPVHLDDILRSARPRLTTQKMVDDVLPSSVPLLVTVVRLQSGDPALATEHGLVLAKAQKALESSKVAADERRYWRGAILALQGNYAAAADEYQQAVKLRPGDMQWRYELAQIYMQRGMWNEAHEQAQWCARIAPDVPEVRALLRQIQEARTMRSP